MNITNTTLPATVKESLLLMDKPDIKIFFKSLREAETDSIGELSITSLTAVQERVKLLKELEHFVLTLPEEVKKPKPKS